MGDGGQGGTERRRHRRVALGGIALHLVPDGAASYLLENLSVGGALLTAGPEHGPGTKLALYLHLPDGPPVGVTARVIRQVARGSGPRALAVAFEELDAGSLKALLRTVEALPAGEESVREVLVVDGSLPTCHQLVRDLWTLGCHASFATTPMEATLRLQNPVRAIDAILVGGTGSEAGGLLSHVAEEFPSIRRIALEPSPSGRAHVTLPPRFGLEELGEVLGLKLGVLR